MFLSSLSPHLRARSRLQPLPLQPYRVQHLHSTKPRCKSYYGFQIDITGRYLGEIIGPRHRRHSGRPPEALKRLNVERRSCALCREAPYRKSQLERKKRGATLVQRGHAAGSNGSMRSKRMRRILSSSVDSYRNLKRT